MRSLSRLPLLLACFLLAHAPAGFAANEAILQFYLRKAGGQQVVYQFRTPATLPAGDFEESVQAQHAAGVAALAWAKRFYDAREVFLRSVEFKALPTPHYLATFDGEVGRARQPFYAVVLGDSTVLEPVESPAPPG